MKFEDCEVSTDEPERELEKSSKKAIVEEMQSSKLDMNHNDLSTAYKQSNIGLNTEEVVSASKDASTLIPVNDDHG